MAEILLKEAFDCRIWVDEETGKFRAESKDGSARILAEEMSLPRLMHQLAVRQYPKEAVMVNALGMHAGFHAVKVMPSDKGGWLLAPHGDRPVGTACFLEPDEALIVELTEIEQRFQELQERWRAVLRNAPRLEPPE